MATEEVTTICATCGNENLYRSVAPCSCGRRRDIPFLHRMITDKLFNDFIFDCVEIYNASEPNLEKTE